MNGIWSGTTNSVIAISAMMYFDDWRVMVPVLASGFACYAGGLWWGMFRSNGTP